MSCRLAPQAYFKSPPCALNLLFIVLRSNSILTFSWWRHRRRRCKPMVGLQMMGVWRRERETKSKSERERNMIDCMSITEYVCNATLCGFDLLGVGSESCVAPGVHRHVCSFVAPMREWRDDERDRQRNRVSDWTRQRRRQTARVSVYLQPKLFFCCSSAPIFQSTAGVFKTDAKTKMSSFLSPRTSLQHVQLEWFVRLSANIVTMQVFSHQCAGYLCC